MKRGKYFAISLLVLLVAALTLAGAILVITFPSFLYPEPIVNVRQLTNTTFSFQLRCDEATNVLFITNILFGKCETSSFLSNPSCTGTPPYLQQVYTQVIMQCHTGYLSETFQEIDLHVNHIAVAFIVLLLLFVLFMMLNVGLCCCCCKLNKKIDGSEYNELEKQHRNEQEEEEQIIY